MRMISVSALSMLLLAQAMPCWAEDPQRNPGLSHRQKPLAIDIHYLFGRGGFLRTGETGHA